MTFILISYNKAKASKDNLRRYVYFPPSKWLHLFSADLYAFLNYVRIICPDVDIWLI